MKQTTKGAEGMSTKELKRAIKAADKIRGQEFFGELFEADAILAAGEAARKELEARENAQISMLDEIETANQTVLF